jgi:hypothetical protein
MLAEIIFEAQVGQLIKEQLTNWAFATKNYTNLNGIKQKKLQFQGFHFIGQFNPNRIISSSAKIDKNSIEKRNCFLCGKNRPVEQQSIDFNEKFEILLNPYPIFPQHLTIIHKEHVPQLILQFFQDMMEIAKALPSFTLFYNGPQFGASAPDHFHFQAGTKAYMPLDRELYGLLKLYGKPLKSDICQVWKIDDGIRKFFYIESVDRFAIEAIHYKIYEMLQSYSALAVEPGLNIHCLFENKTWKVLIFPRGKHRPWQYTAEGDENIMFSPASVDLGGLLIFPLQKNFDKLDSQLATDLMKQIGPDTEIFEQACLSIKL